jgi:two-component sensor histidine kinase
MRESYVAELITLRPDVRSWGIDAIGHMLPRRGLILSTLFDAASPLASGGPPILYSIWNAEAMNRAKNMCQLAMLLEYHRWNGTQQMVSYRAESACANQLASAIRSLEISDADEVLPCSELICEISSCLVALFRPALGQITLNTACERIALSACRRRALILAAMELVTQTLFHAFDRCKEGQLSVTLTPDRCRTALLHVEDSGSGLRFDTQASRQVIGQLGSVLGAEVSYRRSASGGTATKMWFAVQ